MSIERQLRMGRQGRGIKKLVPNYASTLHCLDDRHQAIGINSRLAAIVTTRTEYYQLLINNSNYINNNSRVCKTGVLIVN